MRELHPVLHEAAVAARAALAEAQERFTRAELEASLGDGADGTPTMRVDALVEEVILRVAESHGVNVLSEEVGFVDCGSALTLVVDPLDGSANAAADVPLSCFSAAMAVDGALTQALTMWLETGRVWAGTADGDVCVGGPWRTTGRTSLGGAAVSLLRPHPHTRAAWWAVTERAARVRILSTTALEAMLVLQGSTDAFADAASDTHRLVDLVAAVVLLPLAGGTVIDLHGRPIVFDTDLTKRWSGIVAATPTLAAEIVAVIVEHELSPTVGASVQSFG